MITDFNEIKNEKDREIYVQCRQILDTWFLNEQKTHESKTHLLHECWNSELDPIREGFFDVANHENFNLKHVLGAIRNINIDLITQFQYCIIAEEIRSKMEVKH